MLTATLRIATSRIGRASHASASGVPAQAAVHGYVTAFWWSAAIFAAGAILCGLLLRSGTPQTAPGAEPALA